MASLQPIAQNPDTLVKMILIGDSGSGKTGALASLVEAGYELRILDFDNKIATGYLPRVMAERNLDFAKVDFEALRDDMKSSPMGFAPAGIPQAYMKGVKLVDKWSDGTIPKDWGPKKILVVDSLTFLSDAAFAWAKAMNPSSKDPRQWFGASQALIEEFLAYVTGANFKTNVIIISHVTWTERPDGTMKGYPSAVGKALGPTIPAYFDNLAMMEQVGVGNTSKRVLRTTATSLIDLKNPAAQQMMTQYPIDTGLADFFKTLKGS